ncbi:MAG: hypothetical protein ABIR96_04825 [Bdellovibrionota bacterium]
MSRIVKQMVVQVCVLATVMVGCSVFASEFDPKTGELVAPDALVVREDVHGERVLLTVEKAPKELKTEADMKNLAIAAEKAAATVDASEGGAEGSGPSEFDKTSGTAAWYYWYYPNNYSYNYYYSYGCYSYYPVSYYNYGYYRYYYYYRW